MKKLLFLGLIWAFCLQLQAQNHSSLYYAPRPDYLNGFSACDLYNPLIGYNSDQRNPTFFDWDGDGLMDLFIGLVNGRIAYFRNIGTKTTPCFKWVTNNFGGIIAVPPVYAAPFVTDLNGDGKPDFLVGNGISGSYGGNVNYFQGMGTVNNPAFVLVEDTLAGMSLTDASIPFAVDINHDGKIDVYSGEGYGGIYFAENTGTPQMPEWDQSYHKAAQVSFRCAPQLVNIMGDSSLELVAIDAYGTMKAFANTSANPDTAIWEALPGAFTNIDACANTGGCIVRLAFADLNGDTLLDLLIASNGNYQLYFNTGTAQTPGFDQATAVPLPLTGQNFSAAFADLDSDGKKEMYLPGQNGKVAVFENEGTPTAPFWVLADPDFLHFTTTFPKSLAFGDLNKDGKTDAVVGNFYPAFTGESKMQIYLNQNGTLIYTPSPSLENFPFNTNPVLPEVIDLNKDGVMDLFVENSSLLHFINPSGNGTDWVPADLAMFAGGAFNGEKIAFADLDNDGDEDAVASGINFPLFYENTGSDMQPAFVPKSYFMNALPGGFATPVQLTDDCGLELFLDDQFFVYEGIKPYIKPVSQSNLCSNAPPKKLEAEPIGGWWEGADLQGYFHPGQGPGAYLVIYHYPEPLGCYDRTDSVWLYVTPAPEAEIATLNGMPINTDTVYVCINSGQQQIAPANSCGYFSGVGSSGIFNPASWGLGTRVITYICSLSGCTDRDTLYVTVIPPPTVVINQVNGDPIMGNSVFFCQNAGSQTMSATPSGGVFGGVASPQGVIDPVTLDPGTYQATYTVEQYGCTTTYTLSVTIKALPDPTISIAGNIPVMGDSIIICQTDTILALTPAQLGGVFTPGNSFNPASLSAGPHLFQYTISQNGCVTSSTLTVFIQPFPDPAIVQINGELLVNDTIWIHIDSGLIVLMPAQLGGVFSGAIGSDGVIDPIKLGKGVFTIIYTVWENDCFASSKTVIVIETTVSTEPDVAKKNQLDLTLAPNPTSGEVAFSLGFPKAVPASLYLYTTDGRLAYTVFVEQTFSEGHHTWNFTFPDETPHGLYWAVLSINNHLTKKLIILQ